MNPLDVVDISNARRIMTLMQAELEELRASNPRRTEVSAISNVSISKDKALSLVLAAIATDEAVLERCANVVLAPRLLQATIVVSDDVPNDDQTI